MSFTVIDYLMKQPGSIVRGETLFRADGSVAGYYEWGRWTACPLPEEMRNYKLGVGRAIPSLLCEKDLTNAGHTALDGLIRRL